MKRKTFFLCVLALVSVFTVAKAQEQKAQKQHVVVKVDGLSCPFCAYGLEKQFKEAGMTEIKIDVENALMSFYMVGDNRLNEKEIRKLVKKAGFTARKVTVGET